MALAAPAQLVDHSTSLVLFLSCFVAEHADDTLLETGFDGGASQRWLALARCGLGAWCSLLVVRFIWSILSAMWGSACNMGSVIRADVCAYFAAEARRRQPQAQLQQAGAPPPAGARTTRICASVMKFVGLVSYFKAERACAQRRKRQEQRKVAMRKQWTAKRGVFYFGLGNDPKSAACVF